MDIEQRIADLVMGVSENSSEGYGGVSELHEGTVASLMQNMLNEYNQDPEGFEGRLELLESVQTAIGGHPSHSFSDADITSVSAKGDVFLLKVGNDIQNPDYSFMDAALEGVSEFQLALANNVASNMASSFPSYGIDEAETIFVEAAQWLRDGQEAGLDGIEIPNFGDYQGDGTSNFYGYELDDNQNFVVSTDSAQITTIENINVSAPETPANNAPVVTMQPQSLPQNDI